MREARAVAIGVRTGVGCLLVTMLWVGCLSSTAGSSGGTGGAAGEPDTSTGGMTTTPGTGGFIDLKVFTPGSCVYGEDNPDAYDHGLCTAMPSDPPPPCTRDCCQTCGIDASGSSRCVCDVATGSYSSCTCTPPAGFPTGLSGGNCSPQGYASTVPPATAPAGSVSLKGAPCTKANTVCFTADSTPSSPRGCICIYPGDGVMHCGVVHNWFTFSGGETTYN